MLSQVLLIVVVSGVVAGIGLGELGGEVGLSGEVVEGVLVCVGGGA